MFGKKRQREAALAQYVADQKSHARSRSDNLMRVPVEIDGKTVLVSVDDTEIIGQLSKKTRRDLGLE